MSVHSRFNKIHKQKTNLILKEVGILWNVNINRLFFSSYVCQNSRVKLFHFRNDTSGLLLFWNTQRGHSKQSKKKKNVAAIKVRVDIFLKVEQSVRNLPERLFSLKIKTVVVRHRSLDFIKIHKKTNYVFKNSYVFVMSLTAYKIEYKKWNGWRV